MLYRLDTLPEIGIPCPHDCEVERIFIKNGILFFEFDDDISAHDSVIELGNNARSLTIKVQLMGESFGIYGEKIRKFPKFRRVYERTDLAGVDKYFKKRKLIYIDHLFSRNVAVIHLLGDNSFIFNLNADSIEFDWK